MAGKLPRSTPADAHQGNAARTSLRLRIRGKVQGVYFRESTRAEAERLGVSGWVRNQPDGTVEAHLEGPASAVAALEAWCHRGPEGARVDDVERMPLAPDASAAGSGFRVLR